MALNTRFYIKQNDLLPALTGQFQDEATGNPQDLTGATLTFHMTNPETGTVKVNQAASIDGTPTNGRFRYNWQAGDTNTAGTFLGEVSAVIAGKTITGPNRTNFRVIITPELA